MNSFNDRIKSLQTMIENSKRVVFLGGAGVSTESGIPDFRSKDGLYNQKDVNFDKYEPEYLLSSDCLHDEPKTFFEFYRQKLDCRNIEPNITHKKLVELEEKGILSAIITQNIDNLHQKAGSKNVIEIHGATSRSYCTSCHEEFDESFIFNCTDNIPVCPKCKTGVVRPDVTLYGENLPDGAWIAAIQALETADLLIVGGTSLSVYPANTLTSYYYGDNLVIINRDKTPQDKYAQLIFHESLGDVFRNIMM